MSRSSHGTRNSPRLVRLLGAVALVALAVLATSSRLHATLLRAGEAAPQTEVRAAVPPGWLLQAAALGHQEALADLLWVNALSYFGKHMREANDGDWLDPHLDAITTLDTRFSTVFEWAGTVLMYGGRIDRSAVEASNRVLSRGVRQFPYDWSLWFMLGVNFYFEYPAVTQHELERLLFRQMGARFFARAGDLPNASPTLRVTAMQMMRQGNTWQRGAETARQALLLAPNRTVALNARVALEAQLPPSLTVPMLSERELRLRLNDDPRFRFRTGDFAYVFHPDPLVALAPERLQPPPIERTR